MKKDKSLKRQYLKYIVPSITSQVVFTAYTLVDGIFVARGVSETALAAVNIATPFVTLLWALSITFASGTSAEASRLMGEGRPEEASKLFSRNMTAMLIVALVMTGLTYLCMDPICRVLGTTEATHELVAEYLGAIVPFIVMFLVAYTLEILTATDGYPAIATICVSVSVVVNIVLDYAFIFMWHKGIRGAAIATCLAQVFVIILYLIHFLGPKAHIRFCRYGSLKGVCKGLLKGIGSGINEMSPGLVSLIYVHEIQRCLPEDKLVTNSVIQYILVILLIIGIGIGQGTQPLLSFYNGRKDEGKIKKLLSYEIVTSAILLAVMVAAIVIFAEPIVRVFISSGRELIEYSVFALRITAVSGLIVGYNMIFTCYFTAMEKPIRGSVISLSRSSVYLLIGMFVMVKLLGGDGIWWGITLADLLALLTATVLYKKYNKENN